MTQSPEWYPDGAIIQGERGCVYLTQAELRGFVKRNRILGLPRLYEFWVNPTDKDSLIRWFNTHDVDADFQSAIDHCHGLPMEIRLRIHELVHAV